MSAAHVTVDSLWLCLCPSFSARLLSKAALRDIPVTTHARRFATSRRSCNSLHRDELKPRTKAKIYHNNNALRSLDQPYGESETTRKHEDRGGTQMRPDSLPNGLEKAIRALGSNNLSLEQQQTPLVYEVLRSSASHGRTREVERLVHELVFNRHQEPDARIYNALILVNTNVRDGSVFKVQALLEEMEKEGTQLDISICHSILKVLSIHPDYLLRTEILQYMEKRWYTLSDSGRLDITVGLLREGRLEQASEMLRECEKSFPLPQWLEDLAVHVFLDAGEVDQALHIIHRRLTQTNHEWTKGIWQRLLDVASYGRNHTVVAYVWKKQVAPGYLYPPSGTCLHVLVTAAAVGDTRLAVNVIQLLKQRPETLSADHFEELSRAFFSTQKPDLRSALTALTEITDHKLPATAATALPLQEYLQNHPTKVELAIRTLHDLRTQSKSIPTVIINAIFTSLIHTKRFPRALLFFKSLHLLEPDSTPTHRHKPLADAETFAILLKGARDIDPPAYEDALFLASEMDILQIDYTRLIYDRLILVCVAANQLNTAWEYFEHMAQRGWVPRPMSARLLVVAFAVAEDARAWDLVQRVNGTGPKYEGLDALVEKKWGGNAEIEGDDEELEGDVGR